VNALPGHSVVKQLKGLSPIPLGGMMGCSFAEHVWLEA
jgi:peptide/nickel transport system substrate-binding protein